MSIRARVALTFVSGLAILVALNALGDWLVRISGVTVPGMLPYGSAVRGELVAIVLAALASLVAVLGVWSASRSPSASRCCLVHLPSSYGRSALPARRAKGTSKEGRPGWRWAWSAC